MQRKFKLSRQNSNDSTRSSHAGNAFESFASEEVGSLADQIASHRGALNAKQLAAFLAVSVISIYKLAKRGVIPSIRIAGCVRFCPTSIARWLRERGG